MSWFDEGGSGSPVDVQMILGATPVESAIWHIVQAGAMVSMGTTSDGGALGITVTLDGRWRRQYFRDALEAEVWLSEAATAVAKEAGSTASSASRKRTRRA